ncbi:MAG: hypothetical protein KGQ88_02905, partial [Chloroflexi bacterium]|nr:hypothetical protein [Chloroflexota bacterium]
MLDLVASRVGLRTVGTVEQIEQASERVAAVAADIDDAHADLPLADLRTREGAPDRIALRGRRVGAERHTQLGPARAHLDRARAQRAQL